MPKNVTIVTPETNDTHQIPSEEITLCLPAPRQVEDTLLDEAIRIADINNFDQWDDWGLDELDELTVFIEKVFFIYQTFSKIYQAKRVFRQLANAYHPDHNGNAEKYAKVVGIYNANYRN